MTAVAAPSEAHRRRTRTQPPATGGDRPSTPTSHFVLILWTVIVVVPLLWTLMSSFKTTEEIFGSPFTLPAHWNFDNYVTRGPTRASALLPQHGHRGRLRPGPRDDARLDVRLRARPVPVLRGTGPSTT